ncbi:penicillin-binding protein [Patescibacteria group bacterium]|nr:penicillin-binding protein [Candidatus Falkowbacteria bacterium]MBU3905635.1 penicillin-binding protein [Patescibacteria group bacterium]MBU4015505.1 penicillin-binding protein [Patescibacteria group bacterium]MBU4026529.1 penicillin-binding protein [Patescibacteria group bacterium]MBU4073167.1 penicillin-binding protein [Patescibacteria group bacterium]
MPIPQLAKKIKSPQEWRGKKRKYYVSRDSRKSSWGNKNKFAKPKRHKLSPKIFGFLLKYSAVLLALFVLFLFISVLWLSRSLPDPNKLINRQVAQSTKIYDRTGETILYEIHGAEKRTLVGLDDIPEYLKKATIAIEDKDFYIHGGFSVWAMFRTSITNILRGQKAGGSTLTQQLIKNAVLSSEKTYTRKIKELLLAYRVEKKFSKDEILQMYLNEIPYGSTSYGVEAASRRYFNKSAKDISLAEAAILAALPQAPSRYSPYGSNKDLLIDRQHYILDLMAKQGYITEEEAKEAKKEEVEFKEQSDNITAPHFIMYIKELLSETYGEKMVEQEGLKIYTTIDLYKQRIAEEVVAELAEKNETNYNASNAALISIDPKTGQILAMVGSRDYFNDDIDGQVNVILQPRQPGSSFKPMVYAASFIKGYTPDTVLYDVVTNFSNDPDEPYEPHNYDNQEHGPVTIKKALAGSLNIPAVKAIYLAGTENVFDLADNLGYTTLSDRSRFGLSLVLGGGEVKLIEHANAYSAFAREGELRPVSGILRIEDKDGKIIEEFKDKKKKVFDANIARMINGILSDNSARAYAFGEENWLTLGSRPVAAKTGTTNDYRDAWTIGYTPSIVTGVWVGNNDNSEMKRGAAGGSAAAPIWHNFMQRVLGDTPIEYFNAAKKEETGKPVLDGLTSGEIKVQIDRASGLLATEYTPESFMEERIFKESHCILYYLDKDDPRGDPPKDPSKDPQFDLWESRVLEWAEKQGVATSAPPTGYDNVHKPENRPSFTIEYPTNNQIIMEPILSASIKASAPGGINRAEYYADNNLLAVSYNYPFSLSENVSFLNNGFHKLSVKVCDVIDNCSENSLEFNLILDENQTSGSIGVSWKNLSDGLALNKIDFPFTLEANVINPGQTAKVIFYLSPKNEEVEKIIAIAQPIQSDIASAVWTTIPASGAYRIYAEAHGWNGQMETSEELMININNENTQIYE